MVRRNWSRDPFQPWREEVERFFSSHFPVTNGSENPTSTGRQPAVNLWETESDLFAEAELPGVRQEDLEILVVGEMLTIKGNRSTGAAEGEVFHRRERTATSFERTLQLPVDVDAEKVVATLRDGVLTITLPKAEASKPRKIPVQAGN